VCLCVFQVTSVPSEPGHGAADQLNISDQSAATSANDNTVGGATANSQSADTAESTTSAKNTELCQGDGETVSGPTEGSNTVNREGAEMALTLAGSETVGDEKGIKADDAAGSVEKQQCDTEAADKVNADNAAIDNPTANSETTGTNASSSTATAAAEGSSAEKNIDIANDYLALTYLVHPPDGSTFNRPYVDDFWPTRWVRMEPEIRRMLRKSTRLASDVIELGSSSDSDSDIDGTSDDDDYDYEDSLASGGSPGPIFVTEKKGSSAAAMVEFGDEKDFCEEEEEGDDEIILDESSSNAILVADDDDEVDYTEDVDEIICSGGTSNEGDNSKKSDADSSILIGDADSSVTEDPGVSAQDVNTAGGSCCGLVAGTESGVIAVDSMDISPNAGTRASCSQPAATEATAAECSAGSNPCSISGGTGLESIMESGLGPGRDFLSSQPVDSVPESMVVTADSDLLDQCPEKVRNGSADVPPLDLPDNTAGAGKPSSPAKPVCQAGTSSSSTAIIDGSGDAGVSNGSFTASNANS